MPMAFVLINAEIGSEDAVVKELKAVSNVKEAYMVYGVYDIVAKVAADSKALMCLGLALPVSPSFLAPFWQPPFVFYPFPIAILVNSFLLSIGSAVFLLARNLFQRASAGRGLFQ